jgi:hypothetical protein
MTNGDMYPSVPSCYGKWGYAGQLLWTLRLSVMSGDRYLQSLIRQTRERGTVPPDVWNTHRQREIAKIIADILVSACWGEQISFHPSDPWIIIGKCEVSNMSDLDAIYRIEKAFNVKLFDNDIAEKVLNGLTFGDLVCYIEKNERQDSQTLNTSG